MGMGFLRLVFQNGDYQNEANDSAKKRPSLWLCVFACPVMKFCSIFHILSLSHTLTTHSI